MKKPISLYLLILLLGFLSVGALYGGWSLITDPTGGNLQLPIDFIKTSTSPFADYLIPGIILFTLNGLLPLFIIFSLIKKPKISFLQKINPFKSYHWAWTLSGVLGLGLIIWIAVEVYITQMYYPSLQLPFLGLGLIIILLDLMPKVRRYLEK
ncbi:MAG: hypothetical protein PHU86_04140 [Patescibacteria group bacterium]|jgi:uncharacterized membrane protein|nr:hypothetical protein [Patescibacteria group bacterium]